jgi:transposase
MDVIHDRVAGLDVHKDTVVACVRAMSGNRAMRECRTYATTTEGLLALLEWLNSEECGLAAMEAMEVYWLPVWKILSQGEFELILANAAHIKAVPRAQDGPERRDVDCRPRRPWLDQGELRSRRRDA